MTTLKSTARRIARGIKYNLLCFGHVWHADHFTTLGLLNLERGNYEQATNLRAALHSLQCLGRLSLWLKKNACSEAINRNTVWHRTHTTLISFVSARSFVDSALQWGSSNPSRRPVAASCFEERRCNTLATTSSTSFALCFAAFSLCNRFFL